MRTKEKELAGRELAQQMAEWWGPAGVRGFVDGIQRWVGVADNITQSQRAVLTELSRAAAVVLSGPQWYGTTDFSVIWIGVSQKCSLHWNLTMTSIGVLRSRPRSRPRA